MKDSAMRLSAESTSGGGDGLDDALRPGRHLLIAQRAVVGLKDGAEKQ